MDNPHEAEQNALRERIINSMQGLNDSVKIMNETLEQVNRENVNSEVLLLMFEHYMKNAGFHMKATGDLKKPL